MGYIDSVRAVLARSIFGTTMCVARTTRVACNTGLGAARRVSIVFACAWPLLLNAEFRFEPKPSMQTQGRVNAEPQHEVFGIPLETPHLGHLSEFDLNSAQVDSSPRRPRAQASSQSGWRIGKTATAVPPKDLAQIHRSDDKPRYSDSLTHSPSAEPALFADVSSPLVDVTFNDETRVAHAASVRSISEPAGTTIGTSAHSSAQPSSSRVCANFEFAKGLLKANLVRALAQCGLTIGRWGIGDEEYEYDMEIPKAYLLNVAGVAALLTSVEATYLIRGTRNTLDQTIDFEPSRGAILEGMEIKEW